MVYNASRICGAPASCRLEASTVRVAAQAMDLRRIRQLSCPVEKIFEQTM
jgi:hypothetical protein